MSVPFPIDCRCAAMVGPHPEADVVDRTRIELHAQPPNGRSVYSLVASQRSTSLMANVGRWPMTSRVRRSVSGFTGLVGRIACPSAVRKTDRKGSHEVLRHPASLRPGGGSLRHHGPRPLPFIAAALLTPRAGTAV